MNKNSNAKPVPLIFQFSMIGLTIFIVSICLYRSFNVFTTTEQKASTKKITPELLAQFGGHPGLVNVGLSIDDFLSFDPVKNDFVFIGTIWFEFNPAAITLALLSKFRFKAADILEKSEPEAKIINDKFIARYTIKVRFKNQLQYQYFPFDDHRIILELANPYVSTSDVIFHAVESNFLVKADTTAIGWKKMNREVNAGYVETEINEGQRQTRFYYPVVVFSVDYLRNGIRYAFTILLPLLAIFFISLMAFSLNPVANATLAITLSAGSVTALLAYRFVIENLSPTVGYFMLSDFIFFLFLCMVSLIFIFSIVLRQLPLWLKFVLVFIFHAIVCSAFIYLALFWMAS